MNSPGGWFCLLVDEIVVCNKEFRSERLNEKANPQTLAISRIKMRVDITVYEFMWKQELEERAPENYLHLFLGATKINPTFYF